MSNPTQFMPAGAQLRADVGTRAMSAADAGVMAKRLAVAPHNDRFQIYYGNRLTPQVVTSAVTLANVGQMYLFMDVLDEVREMDPHLQALLSKREKQTSGAKWSCVAEDAKDAEAVQIAAWCEKELRGIRNLRKVFAHMMGGLYYAHGIVENVWFNDRGSLRLLKMECLHPRRFGYANTDWRLRLWDQTGNEIEPTLATYPGLPLDGFPRGKFIVHRPHVRGGYPTREGLGRTAVWYSMFKRWTWRDWMSLAEWAGRGLRVGTYKVGNDDGTRTEPRALDEDVQALSDAMEYMSSSLQVIIPDTVSLAITEMKGARSGDSVHSVLSRECDSQNSKLVLGGTLTTDPGSMGARSLGDTQKDEQIMLAISDAEEMCETFRYDVLAPMVLHRFGPSAPVPLIKIFVEPADSLDALANRVSKLASAGLAISQKWAYETFNIEPPAEGDLVMIPREPVENPEAIGVDEARTDAGVTAETLPTADANTPDAGTPPAI
jgi:phage gp29-like protein